MKKPSLLVIFLAVFMDLIGFGIVLPLLPKFSQNLGASGLLIGLIMSSYSLMQFVMTPAWGRLSDKIGRRPVILTNTAGAAFSYVLFAIGCGLNNTTGLAVIMISRICAGICGTNITVAQAYIADITPPDQRSKRMGLIGMAFGLGFVCGPILGAVSLSGFNLFGFKFAGFGLSGPGWVAASLCAINFVLAYCVLGESWKPNSEHVAQRPRMVQLRHTLTSPKLGLLIGIFFLATFCFTCFETTLTLLVDQNFHLDVSHASYLFAYCGIVGAVVQGGAIGRLVRKMGEPGLIVFSMFMVAIGLAALPFINLSNDPKKALLLVFLGILSIGSSLLRPPVFGLISVLASAGEQGLTLGVAQSAGSVARIVGPMFALPLFVKHPAVPYLACGTLALVTAGIAYQSLCGKGESLAVGKGADKK
jgi:MFS family permease